MAKVNIYIETNISGVKPADGKIMTILEFVASNGQKATCTLQNRIEQKTAKQAVLEAVIAALDRLNRSCDVTLYLEEKYVCETIRNSRASSWQKNHWRNAKDNEVAYKEQWQQYLKSSMIHHVYVAGSVDHTYKSWMKSQIM